MLYDTGPRSAHRVPQLPVDVLLAFLLPHRVVHNLLSHFLRQEQAHERIALGRVEGVSRNDQF